MKRYDGIAVHFGEIWLKGRNRSTFVNRLYSNIESALEGEDYEKLENMRDRFFLRFSKGSEIESIRRKLSKVFGIGRFSLVMISESSLDEIIKTAGRIIEKGDTVRIVPHRSVKTLKFDSSEIVSYFIKNSEKLRFRIDKDAEKDLFINASGESTFLYTERIQGAGGLPVGSSGSAVILLSGGIDSPVAAFYAMKRGLKPIYLHVHAFPSNNDGKLAKIRKLAAILSAYSGSCKIYFAPGHVFQSAAMKAPKKYELVLFKLFLYRLAEKISEKEAADCIVGGESLGQVASQTLGNLTASQQGIRRFIMRPLIGFDKQEIINHAKAIGTFEESIKEYKDVCAIAAANPATNSNPEKIRIAWEKTSLDSAVELTLEKASV